MSNHHVPVPSRSGLRRALLATAVAGALVGGSSLAASASTGSQEPGMAAQFVARINSERAGSGRPALAVSSALTGAAERWAAAMARRNTLAHNPDLAGEVSGWHYLGENVGVGYSVSSLESAFWDSAEHRSNILDPHYTRVGVAVVDVGGKLWVAEEFEQPYGASSSSTHRAPSRATGRTSRSGVRAPLTGTSAAATAAAEAAAAQRQAHPNRCPLAM
jgi:uncharacterized protein YkwD